MGHQKTGSPVEYHGIVFRRFGGPKAQQKGRRKGAEKMAGAGFLADLPDDLELLRSQGSWRASAFQGSVGGGLGQLSGRGPEGPAALGLLGIPPVLFGRQNEICLSYFGTWHEFGLWHS